MTNHICERCQIPLTPATSRILGTSCWECLTCKQLWDELLPKPPLMPFDFDIMSDDSTCGDQTVVLKGLDQLSPETKIAYETFCMGILKLLVVSEFKHPSDGFLQKTAEHHFLHLCTHISDAQHAPGSLDADTGLPNWAHAGARLLLLVAVQGR